MKPAPFRVNENEPEVRFPQSFWCLERLKDVAAASCIIALISSGWWRGKSRFWFLGAGFGLIGVMFVVLKSEEAIEARKAESRDWRDATSPIHRICDTIMLYAVKDGASQIRMVTGDNNIQVFYLINEVWHEQMRIPKYVWAPLKNELTVRASSGTVEFSDEGEQGRFALRILIEPPLEEVLLTLKS